MLESWKWQRPVKKNLFVINYFIGYGYQHTYPIRRRFTRSTCYRQNVSKDATSRFGSNENIFPVCQSFEIFHLVDSKCFRHVSRITFIRYAQGLNIRKPNNFKIFGSKKTKSQCRLRSPIVIMYNCSSPLWCVLIFIFFLISSFWNSVNRGRCWAKNKAVGSREIGVGW
jgi:hypothetical protein